MVDFLRANPFMTIEDYKWNYSIPMILLMRMDYTHEHYFSKSEMDKKNIKQFKIPKNETGVSIL